MTDPTVMHRTEAEEIGDAWIECLRVVERHPRWYLRLETNARGTFYAVALPPFAPYEEWMVELREGFGDTPAEALDDLRVKLYALPTVQEKNP